MRPVPRPDKRTTFMFRLSGNLRVSNSWSPKRLALAYTEIVFTSALYNTTQWCNLAESTEYLTILALIFTALFLLARSSWWSGFLSKFALCLVTPAVLSRIVTRSDFIVVSRSFFLFIFSIFSRQVNLFAVLFLSGRIVVLRLYVEFTTFKWHWPWWQFWRLSYYFRRVIHRRVETYLMGVRSE